MKFYKYQGTGNDFVMIDDREEKFDINNHELVRLMCHRRFGVGADGLILLRNHEQYDFEMIYFNADGHIGSMCGNGGRCTVKFAQYLGLFEEETEFWAVDGLHKAHMERELVHLQMNPPLGIEQGSNEAYFMDTGSPHYVAFVEDVKAYNVVGEGKEIRYSDRFKNQNGTNVNFAEKTGVNSLSVRTYERGVEDETYACGTGVTACSIAANLEGMTSPISVEVLGGKLQVSFERNGNNFENVYLIGPAECVFEGLWVQ